MRVVIAGGSGFLGNALAWAWAEEGHDVRILTRSIPPGQARHESGTGTPGITNVGWTPDGQQAAPAAEIEGAAAIVNLAGAPINGGRWNAARKQAIRDSRIAATGSRAPPVPAAT
jgi:NAD dependent epimerase/dehydratase family enzyme